MWPLPRQPKAEPPEVDRQDDLLRQLTTIDSQLRLLDHEAKEFRLLHEITTDRFRQIIRMSSPSLSGRASVERDWRGLLREGDRLLERRNKILAEWSALKMGRVA